jgi:putative endonuclease
MTVNHGVPGSSPGGGAIKRLFRLEQPFAFKYLSVQTLLYPCRTTSMYLYILKSESGGHYLGISEDPWKRLTEHNGVQLKVTYTSKHRPWELKAAFKIIDGELSPRQIESFVKKQKSRNMIERLIDPHFVPKDKLAQLVRVPHMRD